MAFKAEELTTQIGPTGAGLWAACPESTIQTGKDCKEHTNRQCPQNTNPPGGGKPCPQDSRKPPKKAEGPDRDALVLLQAQLRDRMAQGSAAGL